MKINLLIFNELIFLEYRSMPLIATSQHMLMTLRQFKKYLTNKLVFLEHIFLEKLAILYLFGAAGILAGY